MRRLSSHSKRVGARSPRTQAEAFYRFAHARMPLHSAGKLGVVLFQLPPYVYSSRGSYGYVKWAAEHLPEYRMAVEFCNGRWMDDEHAEDTLDSLERHGLTCVCRRAAGFQELVPPLAASTAEVAEVRFHGRNAETWRARGITAAERFKYDYSPDELEEWVPRIESLDGSADSVHLMMNNCYEYCGIRSARQPDRPPDRRPVTGGQAGAQPADVQTASGQRMRCTPSIVP